MVLHDRENNYDFVKTVPGKWWNSCVYCKTSQVSFFRFNCNVTSIKYHSESSIGGERTYYHSKSLIATKIYNFIMSFFSCWGPDTIKCYNIWPNDGLTVPNCYLFHLELNIWVTFVNTDIAVVFKTATFFFDVMIGNEEAWLSLECEKWCLKLMTYVWSIQQFVSMIH